MSPDAFIPLYYRDFFEAVRGHPDFVGMGYLKAICHYWGHAHCKGLKNESEFLRRVCEVDRDNWELARSVIFDNDNFFTIGEDGLWHQKRAAVLWKEAKAAYDAKLRQTAAATAARRSKT